MHDYPSPPSSPPPRRQPFHLPSRVMHSPPPNIHITAHQEDATSQAPEEELYEYHQNSPIRDSVRTSKTASPPPPHSHPTGVLPYHTRAGSVSRARPAPASSSSATAGLGIYNHHHHDALIQEERRQGKITHQQYPSDASSFEMKEFPSPPPLMSSPRSPQETFRIAGNSITFTPPSNQSPRISPTSTPHPDDFVDVSRSPPAFDFHTPPSQASLNNNRTLSPQSTPGLRGHNSPKPLYLRPGSQNYTTRVPVPNTAIPGQIPSYSTYTPPSWDSHHTPRSVTYPHLQSYRGHEATSGHMQNRLLPSPMPLPDIDTDSNQQYQSDFDVVKSDDKSRFDESPPVSPTDTEVLPQEASKKRKGKKDKSKKLTGPPPLFRPTLGLLFSLSTRTDKLTLLLPACLFSLASGIIPPLMTFVLGEAFDVFAAYQAALSYQSTLPSSVRDMSEANATLKHDMINVAIKLIVLGVLAVVVTTAALWLWVWHGERVAKRLRHAVYVGIIRKPLAWFDLGMGKRAGENNKDDDGNAEDQENESSGGLMGRFARETDDVRMALSSVAGRVVTCLCTITACLAVAFWHSYQLTFVILGSAPIIVIITIVVEIIVTPLIVAERNVNAAAASRVERVTAAISTVKAFNAEQIEFSEFSALTERGKILYNKITMLWGFRAGAVQFMLLTMFVTGFWFGNHQVQSGQKTAGDVTIVFWATLLASSNMQMALPMLNILDKAKVAMAALLETAHEVSDLTATQTQTRPTSTVDSLKTAVTSPEHKHFTHVLGNGTPPLSPATPVTHIPVQSISPMEKKGGRRHRRNNSKTVKSVRELKKIHPSRFTGELALHNVTFHYPSRPAPAPAALKNVSMYLPAKDTTYIVGGSGSGKSTIGSLILGLYKPELGHIEADEQGIEWLDEHWLRGHIGMVSQGASVIFDGTVHENVALGVVGAVGNRKRRPEDVTREEVIQACLIAFFDDFVSDLPDGYDTILSGEKGASLSGGQRQRLALARAYIRDPTVLILDEATSALDSVTRTQVYDAIKKWRRNRTTIIITHDLTPITGDDFVYVMRDGEVVEQGYRHELESQDQHQGWFRHLAQVQATSSDTANPDNNFDEVEERLAVPAFEITPPREDRLHAVNRISMSPAMSFASGNEDLGDAFREYQTNQRRSRIFLDEQEERRQTLSASPNPGSTPHLSPSPRPEFNTQGSQSMLMSRSGSIQKEMPALTYSPNRRSIYGTPSVDGIAKVARLSIQHLERAAAAANPKRPTPDRARSAGPRESWFQLQEVTSVDKSEDVDKIEEAQVETNKQAVQPGLKAIFREMLPMVPNKLGLVLGLILCVASGICTPMFSTQFSQLLAALSDPGSVNLLRVALLLLLIAGIDGLAQWGKYTILQHVSMGWVLKMQQESFHTVLMQEKAWYDDPKNIPINLVTTLVKDAEDARNLIGYVAGNLFVVISMILMGLIWAFVVGWQLTLVGLAMGPLFVLSTMASTRILGTYERINKSQREECSRRFYTGVSNIKAIRSMSLEPIFLEKFERSVREAYTGGKKSAFFTGFGTGIAFFVIYVAQAIMFLVGALFIIQGTYTFQQVMQVFVLLIFSITFATQVLQNVPQIAKAKFATSDLLRLHAISCETAESQGRMTFPVSGRIVFENVSFSYPSRPDAKVLQNVSFEIHPGECVGIVGPSGSGKSTVAALLQRLYEPSKGEIRIDGRPLTRIDAKFLRDHVAVVSQHPALFDMSIAENIAYGRKDVPLDDIVKAAKAAHVHDFIMSLPDDYKTNLGENAGLISGGQAQRLQIARALLRPREILLGDEITSALDAENQEAVMKTIADVKKERTTVLITHKLATMQMCDRLIVVDKGRIVQHGTYAQLQAQPMGLFASLARGGEWNA